MKLAYAGYDMSGKAVAGVVDAGNRVEAADTLRRQGVVVTRVTDAPDGAALPTGAAGGGATSPRRAARRARPNSSSKRLAEVAGFARQLSILVSAKTPMVQALQATERQTPEGPWRDTLAALRIKVEEGVSLSEAMQAHAASFSPVCRALVQAGEAGGTLDSMLRNLADLTRRQLHTRRTVVGALTYPVVLVSLSSVVLTALVMFVLPRFQELFASIGAELPFATQALINLSLFLRANWYFVGAAVAGLLTCAYFAFRAPQWKLMLQGLALNLPRIGPIMRSFATARIARVLGVLLEAKVGLIEALQLTRQATAHSEYVRLLTSAEERVTRGENLAVALTDPHLMSPSIIEAIASAEKTGQVGPVLSQVAAFMDEDNEVLMKTLTQLLEPLILVFLGVLIGGVAIAMFLPLFDLTAAAGAPGGAP
ncbi:type II secretion system F family protein [soil metagenome]